MPKLAANLTLLWEELPFLERFGAAARAGFRAVEYLFPYDYDKSELAEALARHGLSQVLHNLPAGDWERGERGIAVLPERQGEFRDGVGLAIDYARVLGCTRVNCLAGIAPPGADPARTRRALVENLRFAAGELEVAGIKLLLEPLNTRDVPGFYVSRTPQALELMEEVASPNLYLQYDIYHMQIMEGDLARSLQAHLPRIAHVQLADNPGRHEPGSGEIDYAFLLALLDRLGYEGYVGAEYRPERGTDVGLGWARPYLAAT